MSITLSALQKQRRDTAANWTSANPTLLAGEIGIESDTGYWKVGDGSTVWNSLAYLSGLGGEIPVSRLADGSARQLLQTAANGNDVEWTSNVDIPGTLDVTSTATFDSISQHPLGAAATPSITFTGDTNTGIYSPGADQVAISTNGTGRLYIDATGRVGINTSSPTAIGTRVLHISGAAGESSALRLSGNAGTGIDFIQASNGDGYIYQRDNSPLIFGTNATERLRITASGAVGVGTSTPSDYESGKNNLVVANTGGNAGLTIATSATGYGEIAFADGTVGNQKYRGQISYDHTNDKLVFYSAATTAVTIDASQRVGIGNSAPQYPLQTDTAGTGTAVGDNTAIYVQSQASGRDCNIRFGDSVNASARVGYLSNNLYFYVNGSERLKIDSQGRCGIGTASPTDLLSVGTLGTSTNAILTIGSSTSSYGSIYFGDGVGSGRYRGYIQYNHANDSLCFATSASTAVCIDSSGRLGIGTSSPGTALDVNGAIRSNDIFTLYKNSTDAFYIGAGTIITGGASTDIALRSNQNGSVLFSTNGATERMRIDASGRVGIGTTTPTNTDKLEIQTSSTSAPGLWVQTGGTTSAYPIAEFRTGTNLSALLIRGDGASVFSGKVLVGTSSSSGVGRFVVQGNTSAGDGLAILAYQDSGPGSGTPIGALGFTDSDHTKFAAWIRTERDGGTWSGTSKPGRLVFSTTADGASSPTERMRITNLGVPRFFSSDSGLISAISAGSATNENIFVGSHSATSTTSGTNCILIKANGDVRNTNNSYGAISDVKLKENIVDASSQWDDLKALQVRKYNLKAETGQQTHTQIGLVAQEVELVSPGLVSESPDRDEEGNDLGTVTKSVNYSVLYMKAVKALQEAIAKIETLEGMVAVNNITIDEQQHQLSTLAARLTALESA
jgi:hypothetical protein